MALRDRPLVGGLKPPRAAAGFTLVVVSDEKKAPGGGRQVGFGKANVSEPLMTCRNPFRWHRNRGVGSAAGLSLADD